VGVYNQKLAAKTALANLKILSALQLLLFKFHFSFSFQLSSPPVGLKQTDSHTALHTLMQDNCVLLQVLIV
jgi:hypothetical protein